jgi:6-phosphogluconolactonase
MNNSAVVLRVYVGTYTSNGGRGIYLYSLDPSTGILTPEKVISGVVNPSFLVLDPTHSFLYCVNEVDAYYGKPEGALSAFSVDAKEGELHFLNQKSSLGSAPCHISMDKTGKFVMVANYGGGSVAIFPIEADGRLADCSSHIIHTGSGAHPERQLAPHTHYISTDPSNQNLLAVDLGNDSIQCHPFDVNTGTVIKASFASVLAKSGSGPRQLTFHPNAKWAYVVHELESRVTAFTYVQATGTLHEMQSLATVPSGFMGESYGGTIETVLNGRFLYVSNRGHDSIAYFGIDPNNGTLTYLGWESSGGKFPRHFCIDPENRFLLVGNQRSDSIVVFRIDSETGAPIPTGYSLEIPSPACILAVKVP